jgi:hypothetical protein
MRAGSPTTADDILALLVDLAYEAASHYSKDVGYWWRLLQERNRRMRELDGYADAPRAYLPYTPRVTADPVFSIPLGCPHCGGGFHLVSLVGDARTCRHCYRIVDGTTYN